jgi:hypothetical protein
MIEVFIKADSQEEFDRKRLVLAKKISGGSSLEPKQPYYQAQRDILEYFRKKFNEMIRDIKHDVAEIIG